MSSAAPGPAGAPAWRPATRIAFRFCFLYFGLYILLTQMLTSLVFAATNDNGAWEADESHPAIATVTWLAHHVFGVTGTLVTWETGSGDRVYDWIVLSVILALAVIGTLVWSAIDRRRASYARLYSWFYTVMRFALGATLLTYGAVKIVPLQMPAPSLTRLLEPYGNFSPMGVLWSSIGAAHGYEMFAGAAELAAALLLFYPRTALLGAMLGLVDGVQVFVLNMSYDVPVKLLAFHLIPFALFLLAPELGRLCDVLVRRRATTAGSMRQLFCGARANRRAVGVQVLFAVYLVAGNVYGSARGYRMYGPGRALPSLYGIWNVTRFAQDGQPVPPLTTDAARWSRIVFDYPGFATVYGMDGAAHGYRAALDPNAGTLALTAPPAKMPAGQLNFARTGTGELDFTGTLDGHAVAIATKLLPRNQFLLVKRGFHWIQDRPFNH